MPPAKQLADELEVLEAVRAVTAIHAETVEDALTQVAEVIARARSRASTAPCAWSTTRARCGWARPASGWAPKGGQTVESITAAVGTSWSSRC